MTLSEKIEQEVRIIREHGIKDNLVIVPVVRKRCFIPCNIGRCNCRVNVGNNSCIVTEKIKKECIKEINEEMSYLNEIVGKYNEHS